MQRYSVRSALSMTQLFDSIQPSTLEQTLPQRKRKELVAFAERAGTVNMKLLRYPTSTELEASQFGARQWCISCQNATHATFAAKITPYCISLTPLGRLWVCVESTSSRSARRHPKTEPFEKHSAARHTLATIMLGMNCWPS